MTANPLSTMSGWDTPFTEIVIAGRMLSSYVYRSDGTGRPTAQPGTRNLSAKESGLKAPVSAKRPPTRGSVTSGAP